MSVIQVKKVTKKFKEETVLNDVTLKVSKGEIVGLVGNNGSGKTVLMKCICGFIPIDSGEINVNGKKVGKDVDIPHNLGIIIETPGFLPNFNGYNNLKQLAMIRGKIKKERITEAIELVGLNPRDKKHVGKYSLGMRQRLGLAQAIMEDPDILILDEPMNGLDKDGIVDIREFLLKIKAQGKTILIASHNQQDIDYLCDEVYQMDKGKINKIK